jgi:glycine cleavage system H protein
MAEFLETSIDKFIFKVATDRLYTQEGFWVKAEGGAQRIGVSDFFQQLNGDVAFVNLQPRDNAVNPGNEIVSIETIKVDISLNSPVTGKIIEVNKELDNSPEFINLDPYDKGWIYLVIADNWTDEVKKLLTPEQYFKHMKKRADEELKKNG